jgi:hypothetical protein
VHAAETSSRYQDWADTGGYAHTELHRQPRAHQHCMRAPQHARARHALLRWRYLLRLRRPIVTARPSASSCSFAVFVLRPKPAPLRFLAAVVELMRATQTRTHTHTHTHTHTRLHGDTPAMTAGARSRCWQAAGTSPPAPSWRAPGRFRRRTAGAPVQRIAERPIQKAQERLGDT